MKKLLLVVVALFLTACSTTKPNFVFNDQTAVDQNTGLVWVRNADMPGHQLIWRGDDNVYEFVKHLNADNFAGYADWRVPTMLEFTTMIGYATSLGYDKKDMKTWPFKRFLSLGFTNVHDYEYWTATRESPTEMWTADLISGRVAPRPENRPYYLWLVRGNGGR